jgi:hypothetical protein
MIGDSSNSITSTRPGITVVLGGCGHLILRPSNVYGEGQRLQIGQGVIGVLADRALRGKELEIWGTGDSLSGSVLPIGETCRAGFRSAKQCILEAVSAWRQTQESAGREGYRLDFAYHE